MADQIMSQADVDALLTSMAKNVSGLVIKKSLSVKPAPVPVIPQKGPLPLAKALPVSVIQRTSSKPVLAARQSHVKTMMLNRQELKTDNTFELIGTLNSKVADLSKQKNPGRKNHEACLEYFLLIFLRSNQLEPGENRK